MESKEKTMLLHVSVQGDADAASTADLEVRGTRSTLQLDSVST